jgi:hypothetical protein
MRLGTSTIALAATLVIASPPAPAGALRGLPEIGRCKPASPVAEGAFKFKNCVGRSPLRTGSFEWFEVGENHNFSAVAASVTLETHAHAKVSCENGELLGEWKGGLIGFDSSEVASTVSLAFHGCKNAASGETCQSSPAAPSDISTSLPLEGELGFISEEPGEPVRKIKVGLDLRPEEPATVLLSFTCGGPPEEFSGGEAWTLEGSVIGQIAPIDKMTLSNRLIYRARGAEQIPEAFLGGFKDTLLATRTVGSQTTREAAGLTLRDEVTRAIESQSEEEVEIKARD